MDDNFFLELCAESGYSKEALSLFEEALDLAREKLFSVQRLAGDSYYDHNLRVAVILAENHSLPEVVVAGILHGITNHFSEERIRELFGEDVLKLVKSEEEIKSLKEKNSLVEAEILRKILMTTFKDVRVILLKLANKLDNLSTISYLPKEQQEQIAIEALEVYAPLANRLGMEKIKTRLEDLALQTLDPKGYQRISDFLQKSGAQREMDVEEVIQAVRNLCRGRVKVVNIKGRLKHIYSIYKKLRKKSLQLEDLQDLLGIRVIVPEIKDCYTLLGILHENYEPLEGKLKDYIANPKPNFYRSIHTALRMPNRKVVEIQIRTPEMDEFANEGIAAHWKYKGIDSDEFFEKKISWLRGILDLQKQEDNLEILETVKVDLFGDEIYCYTPKGDVKELPLGAMVLDFAYAVHEEVGSHAVGARVNGKFVPLKHQLVLGDVVEVLTNKSQRPRRSWVKIVKSARAKQKIRKSLKKYEILPALFYRSLKPAVTETQGVLVESSLYPKAACTLAKCCTPIPGDFIAGLATKRRVISIHRTDCRAALKEEERWVPVNWKETFSQKIQFFVRANERSGLLADLLHTIATARFEVKEAKAKLIDLNHALCSFSVVPRDLNHLKELISRVQKVRGVTKIYFE